MSIIAVPLAVKRREEACLKARLFFLVHSLYPIVVAAGGVMTDWEGKELDLNAPHIRVLAAANPALHAAALEALGF